MSGMTIKGCRLAAYLACGLVLAGCGNSISTQTTAVPTSTTEVLEPRGSEAARDTEATPAAKPAPEATLEAQPGDNPAAVAMAMPDGAGAFMGPAPDGLTAVMADEGGSEADEAITLEPMGFDAFRDEAVKNPGGKLTIVDAWATWCAPCKENFPHLVEMHHAFKDKGLKVVSLSMDDPSDKGAVDQALAFLKQTGAEFQNILLNEEFGVGFERFGINAIPAVFLYAPDGKELRRFTLDDTDRQFTYEEVDEVVALLLDGKPLPEDAPGDPPPGE